MTAGLALVLTSAGAIAAAAAMPSGSTAETGRTGGPGQGRTFPFPGGPGQGQSRQGQGQQGQGQQGQGQQVLPNQQDGSQLPALPDTGSDSGSDSDSDAGSGSGTGGLMGLDPDQLLQLSPDQLLQLLDEQGQLGSDGSGAPGLTDPFGQQGQSPDDADTSDGATRTT